MLKIRNVIYIILVTLLMVSLACSVYFIMKTLQYTSAVDTKTATDQPAYHFVLISEEAGNPYWDEVKAGAKKAGTAFDAAVEFKGPAQSDKELHAKAVEAAIAAKVDGIIVQGLDKQLLKPVINQAIQQGIPVITVDGDVPKSRRIAYVGTDNFQAGFQAGQTLIKATNGSAQVGIITGGRASSSQKQRIKGFRAALEKQSGMTIIAIESSHISRIQAAERAYQIFKEHPDVTALFGTSALDGQGIAAVVGLLDKTNQVSILAFDALQGTLNLINKGSIDATIAQQPYQMGYKSVNLMVDVINGRQVPEINHTKTKVIRAQDLPLNSQSMRKGRERP